MKYLVTGGAGFIGSHLVDRLLENNHEIVIIDDLTSGYISNLPPDSRITFLNQSVQDVKLNKIPGHISLIFHLAAQVSVPLSIDELFTSSSNNLIGTLKVFDWARALNIPVVYASSSAVYGNLPVGNDRVEKYDILSPYAQDKLTMEHYAKLCYKLYHTSSIGLRFFNVYGPRQDPSSPYSGVISIFIDRLLNDMPVTVNGGYQTRDFIYVTDIVDILVKSMELLHENGICQVVNVGVGKSTTIDNLLSMLKEIIKIDPEVIRKDLPLGDPEKSLASCGKLVKFFNVNPERFTPINTGLANTVSYYLLNQNNERNENNEKV